MLRRALEALTTPPGCCIALLLAGALARSRWPKLARWCTVLGIASLWLLSTPLCAGLLLRTLQGVPALPAAGALPAADAIVVLSAEGDRQAPEFGGATVGALTLQRIRYAAALHQRTGLPVLTSGGRPGSELEPLATSMANALEREFATPVRWREERSADTWENAEFSAELLRHDGVRTVMLVTHAWHLPRAIRCFSAQGLTVVPAPTAFRGPAWVDLGSLLPSTAGLRDSAFALHEWYGRFFYLFRG